MAPCHEAAEHSHARQEWSEGELSLETSARGRVLRQEIQQRVGARARVIAEPLGQVAWTLRENLPQLARAHEDGPQREALRGPIPPSEEHYGAAEEDVAKG
jgi:hypothetical protein